VDTFAWKIIVKAFLLLIIPWLLLKRRGISPIPFFSKSKTDVKRFWISIGLGFAIFALILAIYIILINTIDTTSILGTLESTLGVSAANFWLVAIYILIGNSLAEEFFFRGYLVLAEKKSKLVEVFSALLFAIYHVTILIGWFSWSIFVLVFFGLFVGGLLFSWVNRKGKSIYNGWIMHMGADLSIVLIGLWLFYWPK